ncbi:two-component system sensor histidine kinase YesM [Gracilibacillus halotolerans]|uniref:histidine kinase n=2 Tax=Gracilibacillus halotolerans TaxID=74386 RepID=A0A841RQX7_9BACI|nr:two-component system sensor histidine kinase YesM [Gracilibacillus halotolerans]
MDLRLKHKMVLLTSLVLLAFSIGGLFILQYAFQLYNKEIYRQYAQAIQVSSDSIEAELKKMERLSYQVATDTYVQSYLENLTEAETNYDTYMIGSDLRTRLLHVGALNKYVLSIQVYDKQNREYASGNSMIQITDERLQELKQRANEKKGGVNWLLPHETDKSLAAVRDIRNYLDLKFDRIGSVSIRVDMDTMVSDLTRSLAEQDTVFLIYDDSGQKIYESDDSLYDFSPEQLSNEHQGYQIIEWDNHPYFATHSEANNLGWTYVILVPYDNLFTVITKARTAVFITYLLLFFMMIFLGSKFTGSIVNPIESLNRKMKKVQTGNLEQIDIQEETDFPKDEAGEMHANFQKMMQQIQYLIGENYKKQLLIKESEYKTLQAQVNPHFLYNTLESINWTAKIAGEKKISQMAESLGYVLRSSINMTDTLITLEEELSIVEHYITIQSYRFEDRLQFSKNVPDELLSIHVPKFILQPIIENSIRYGLQEMVGICKISLTGEKEAGILELRLTDNGPGMDASYLQQIKQGNYEPKGTGLGLRNINDRIKILFGEEYGLTINSEKGVGTFITIRIPIEGEKEYVQSFVSR